MNVGEWLAKFKPNDVEKYTKPDGTIMVKIGLFRFVNKETAIKLGLYHPLWRRDK